MSKVQKMRRRYADVGERPVCCGREAMVSGRDTAGRPRFLCGICRKFVNPPSGRRKGELRHMEGRPTCCEGPMVVQTSTRYACRTCGKTSPRHMGPACKTCGAATERKVTRYFCPTCNTSVPNGKAKGPACARCGMGMQRFGRDRHTKEQLWRCMPRDGGCGLLRKESQLEVKP